MSAAVPWAPPSDDELTWFKPGGRLPARPTPLEFSFETYAFVFGVSRALESLYFPLYELKAALKDGELYLTSVPSAMAESDLDAQLGRMRDSGIRFTRSVRGAWERLIKREVAEYNDHMAAFPPADASDHDLAKELPRLRRTRANQWFAATRAVFAPTVMLQAGIGEGSAEEALEVTREALDAIRGRGAKLLDAALLHVGERLVKKGSIGMPDDVSWLDYAEVREALESGQNLQSAADQRKLAAVRRLGGWGADVVGPELPPDAPRMYLVREVLALIG